MDRIHRALIKRAKYINPSQVADRAEDYLVRLQNNKAAISGIPGLTSRERIKKLIKIIDDLEREIIQQENKIDTISRRRRLAAARLEEELEICLDIIKENLTPREIKDFK